MIVLSVLVVFQDVLSHTREFLRRRKDDPGRTFSLNPRSLDSFGGAPADVTLAYIIWALTSAGEDLHLDRQLENLVSQAKSNHDPYFLSLVASSLLNLGEVEKGMNLAKNLAQIQAQSGPNLGSVPGAKTSITSSWGKSLLIETTAMSALTWIQAAKVVPTEQRREWEDRCQLAVEWISGQCEGGTFGSTQGTILALKVHLFERYRFVLFRDF